MSKITYPTKSIGDLFLATEANEIKDKFNALVDGVELIDTSVSDLTLDKLNRDGSQSMTGNLDMDGNNMLNVNEINGVDAGDLLTETNGDNKYVEVSGDTMTGGLLIQNTLQVEDKTEIIVDTRTDPDALSILHDSVLRAGIIIDSLHVSVPDGDTSIRLYRTSTGYPAPTSYSSIGQFVVQSRNAANTGFIFKGGVDSTDIIAGKENSFDSFVNVNLSNNNLLNVAEITGVAGVLSLNADLDMSGHDITDTGTLTPETADTKDVGTEALPYRRTHLSDGVYNDSGNKVLGADWILLQSFNADIQITVGSGGDRATLKEALLDASKLYPLFVNEGVHVNIHLLTGFELEEQILMRGMNLRHVTITSVDAEVTVKRSEITTAVDVLGTNFWPTFYGENTFMPTIKCLFKMDTSGTANEQMGIYLWNSTLLVAEDCGLTDTPWDNLHVRDGYVSGNRSVWSNAGRRGIELINARMGFADGVATGCEVNALSIRVASNMFARRADLSNTPGIWTVDIREASTIELRDGNLSNSGTHCIRNEGAAYIHAQRANLTNSAGLLLYNNPPTTSTGGAGGGVVNLTKADGTGSGASPDNITMNSGVIVQGHEGTNLNPDITPNTLDSKGIFFD